MKVWKFSKYITAALVLTVAAGAWAAYRVADSAAQSPILPVSEAERAEAFQKHQAKYIWPTSDYSRLAFINLEKDYYAVQRIIHMEGYPSWYRIVDRNDRTIKDLAEYEIGFVWGNDSISGLYSRDYVTACDDEQDEWYVIDRDTLEVYPAGNNYITMHSETGYYIPSDEGSGTGYEIRSPEGEVLFRSEDPIRMTSEPGYVIRMPEGQKVTQLVDMETGDVLYESRGTEVIEDYERGFTRINGTAPGIDREGNPGSLSCCYFLGPDFKPALDGRLFSSREIYVTDRYIYGPAFIGGYLEGDNNREAANGQWNHTVVVYNHDGQLLFEGEQGDFLLDPIQGDTLAVRRRNLQTREAKYVYVRLTEGGAVS